MNVADRSRRAEGLEMIIIIIIINNNNNNTRDNVYGAVIVRVHPVHLTNVGQCQVAVILRLGQPTWAASQPVGSYMAFIHRRHLLLLGPKADTHFTGKTMLPIYGRSRPRHNQTSM